MKRVAVALLVLTATTWLGIVGSDALLERRYIADPVPGEVWIERVRDAHENPYHPQFVEIVTVLDVQGEWVQYSHADGRKSELKCGTFKCVFRRK